ncbi:hypothetical protein BPNPMPFG_002388 [Mesorhizobium sp. AR07]|uniref:hypothetical protein n=1 Tax=Mesorhizobium sp. AR07 TaxID=2865838 RepID=UPI00215ED53E|nr:hypothetical protein [Mesorhizobium sp. AR07]UVK46690.1 hypothetical protein BPNPMPFG_002388 [Mesorhizobium sp. AR07]
MAAVLPVKVTFVGGWTAIGSSIGEATKALDSQWRNKKEINCQNAARMLAYVRNMNA